MHGNARLTPLGRFTLVLRIEAGRPVAHVAKEMGVSRPTAYKWWQRWQEEGLEGLVDRPSRARSCPHRSSPAIEDAVAELRRELKLGPARIAARLGLAASTVHRVLCRLGLNRLSWLDRPTGRVVRRIHTTRPGELAHVDVKKLGRIPDGGGWRVLGRAAADNSSAKKRARIGYAYLHTAIDAHSRLVFTEALGDERAETCAALASSGHLLRHPRDRCRRRPHRQCLGVPLPAVPGGARRSGASLHPTTTPTDQRQGRALPPDLGRGVGLRSTLRIRSRATGRAGRLAASLQPSSPPHRHRRPTDHPVSTSLRVSTASG